MGVSTPSSFAGQGIVPLWQERHSIFIQPELDYRVGRTEGLPRLSPLEPKRAVVTG